MEFYINYVVFKVKRRDNEVIDKHSFILTMWYLKFIEFANNMKKQSVLY